MSDETWNSSSTKVEEEWDDVAYYQGLNDYRAGVPVERNPYVSGTESHKWYNIGWNGPLRAQRLWEEMGDY
jgi:hypothetical protein